MCGTHSDQNLATSFLYCVTIIGKFHSHCKAGFLQKQSYSKSNPELVLAFLNLFSPPPVEAELEARPQKISC